MTDLRDQLADFEAAAHLPVIGRKAFAALLVVTCVPAAVAGVAFGVAVAVGCDRLRSAFAGPFGYWEEAES